MKVLILGCGYYSSVLSEELKKGKHEISIVDICLFSDEYLENVGYRKIDVIDKPKEIIKLAKDYDYIVWSLDIDVDNFYLSDLSSDYIKKNIKAFKEIVESIGDKLYLITDNYLGVVENYAEFLDNKIELAVKNKVCGIIQLPELYGPSLRMRFDTLLNQFFYDAYINGLIVIGDEPLEKVPTCNIFLAARFLLECMENDISGINEKIACYECSPIEYAFLMQSVFEKNKENQNISIVSPHTYTFEKEESNITSFLKVGRYSISNVVEYMLNMLEKGAIDDITKDKYNNSRIVNNFLSSQRFFEFKESLI